MLKYVTFVIVAFMVSSQIFGASLPEYIKNEQAKKYLENGHVDKAISLFSELLTNDDIAPHILKNIGDAHVDDEDYKKAEDAYLQAIPKLSGDFQRDAYFNLGNAYFYDKDLSKAKDAYIAALQLDPTHMPSKTNLEKTNLLLKQQPQSQSSKQQKSQSKQNQQQQDASPSEPQKKAPLEKKNVEPSPQEQADKAKQQLKRKKLDNKKRAEAILKQLEQQEKEARKKYLDQKLPPSDKIVDNDW